MVQQLKSPDPATWLAYLYAPILRYLKKIRIVRKGPRDHKPQDILVPEGYTVEVVATGFNTPLHCTFDDQGYCYVTEAGHKIKAKPRILLIPAQKTKVNRVENKCSLFYNDLKSVQPSYRAGVLDWEAVEKTEEI